MAIYISIRPGTRLIVMTKKSSFSHFTTVSLSYCPRFWGSRAICKARKTLTFFESYEQKLRVFVLYDRFHGLLPTILRFHGDLHSVRPGTCLRVMTKNSSFSRFMTVFMSYCP